MINEKLTLVKPNYHNETINRASNTKILDENRQRF